MTPWLFRQRQKEDHVRGDAQAGRMRTHRDGRYFPVVADDHLQTEVGGLADAAAAQAGALYSPYSTPPPQPTYSQAQKRLMTMASPPKMGHWPHLKYVVLTRRVV